MAKFAIHKALREAIDNDELRADLIDWVEDHDLRTIDFSDLWLEIVESVEAGRKMAKALLPAGWYIRVNDEIGYVIEDKDETLCFYLAFRRIEDIINSDDAKAAMEACIRDERWSALCGDFDWLLEGKV